MEKIVSFISIRQVLLTLALVVAAFFGPDYFAVAENADTLSKTQDVTVLAFGSCLKADQPQKFWRDIMKKNPDVMVLAGDNVYANSGDPTVLQSHYEMLGADPDFKKMRQSVPLLATWDDHDFGLNDGGADFPGKDNAREAFLNFFNVPFDPERAARPGVYSSYMHHDGDRTVQIILLDTRYFRSPLLRHPKAKPDKAHYIPNPDKNATLLGEGQWKWLEEELRKPAQVRVIVSSIQFLPVQHKREKWANFPHERARMIELLKTTDTKNVVFVSGDRHHGQLYKMQTEELSYPIYEMTTSGLNRTVLGFLSEKDPYTITSTYYRKNFGLIRIDWLKKKLFLEVYKIKGSLKYATEVDLDL